MRRMTGALALSLCLLLSAAAARADAAQGLSSYLGKGGGWTRVLAEATGGGYGAAVLERKDGLRALFLCSVGDAGGPWQVILRRAGALCDENSGFGALPELSFSKDGRAFTLRYDGILGGESPSEQGYVFSLEGDEFVLTKAWQRAGSSEVWVTFSGEETLWQSAEGAFCLPGRILSRGLRNFSLWDMQDAGLFDTARLLPYCENIAALGPQPMPEPSVFEQPQSVRLRAGGRYPVYSGPGKRYVRGAQGRAQVSTNGAVQVYGLDRGMLLISFEVAPGHERFGYIDAAALRAGETVPALDWGGSGIDDSYFSCYPDMPVRDTDGAYCYIIDFCSLTDDPRYSKSPLCELEPGMEGRHLRYVPAWGMEYIEVPALKVRGFVPEGCTRIGE